MKNNVWLEKFDNYNMLELQQGFERAFFDLNLNGLFKPKMKVLIKINMPYAVSKDSAESTHPAVVGALINVLSKLGVVCIVADSPYKKYSLEALDQTYLNTGMLEIANLTKCELNRNLKTSKIKLNNGIVTKSLTLLDVVNNVDAIINVGKVKVDNNLGYLGAISNLFGLVPGEFKTLILNRLSTVEDYNNYLLDLYSAIESKVMLNVMDGIVAQEKDKTPRMLYCLGVSENIFSLDETILNILGIDAANSIIKQAKQREFILDNDSTKVVNKDVKDFKIEDFALPEIDINSKIHNSENEQKRYFNKNQARPKIDANKCKGCSICAKICPTNAINLKYDKNGEIFAEIDYTKCILCNKCITACPYLVAKLHVPKAHRELEKEINKFNKD